jgi:hypothetical protein
MNDDRVSAPHESEFRQVWVVEPCPQCKDEVRHRVYVIERRREEERQYWRCTACQYENAAAAHARLRANALRHAQAIRAKRAKAEAEFEAKYDRATALDKEAT